MKLSEIVDLLNNEFDLHKLGENGLIDVSMMSRVNLIPQEIRSEFSASFFNTMNGLLLQSSEEVNFIVLSTFLSDNVVLSMEKKGYKNSLLIVHHLFDMNCGTPNEMNGVPFHFLSNKSMEIIRRNKISVYAVHLPFDLQCCRFNTSLAFANHLSISQIYEPINTDLLKHIGYETTTDIDIGEYLKSKYVAVYRYGNGTDADMTTKNVAIIAGVISNVNMLKELEHRGITHIICGDIFLCVDSERFRVVYDYVRKTELCIYCLSHNISESYGLTVLADYILNRYNDISCECIFENGEWK